MDKQYNQSLDKETQEILAKQKTVASVVNSDGWKIGRTMFVEKIMELQNAFNIEESDERKMFIDLQANKKASAILYEFLQIFEGTATEAVDNSHFDKSYVVREE